MIFIDPVSKLRSRKEIKHSLSQDHRKRALISKEEVDLSEAVNFQGKFILTDEGMYSLTADMSVIVLIIQTAINALCGKHLPVRAINELPEMNNEWQLNIQPPPVEAKQQRETYSEKRPAKESDIQHYALSIPVLSKDKQICDFNLSVTCNRHFAKKYMWPTPEKKIKSLPIASPYLIRFLSTLPQSLSFDFDDDGEPDQLSPLQVPTSQRTENSFSSTEFPASGLRIWVKYKDHLRLQILGDSHFGAVFVGNILPQKSQYILNDKEKTAAELNTSSHLDIEI
ncbi:hypothetical protein O1D97_05550 [Marinomonas sp. 15G1-11]|uniref:Uncharacterized protein n=1 Tax=Marinomonas phaeophyticola TaxID=3004091 RepID=A0ABT4JTJ0_9GAMM|nr:hypothetical protein [Marinomonas sp. 15G1-11]MCZ2721128.1 hypothetical protein [Marinomonas sp. 15G1-11]